MATGHTLITQYSLTILKNYFHFSQNDYFHAVRVFFINSLIVRESFIPFKKHIDKTPSISTKYSVKQFRPTDKI